MYKDLKEIRSFKVLSKTHSVDLYLPDSRSKMSNLHLINEINRLGHRHQFVQPDHFLHPRIEHRLFLPLDFFLSEQRRLAIIENGDSEIEFFFHENFKNFRQQSKVDE